MPPPDAISPDRFFSVWCKTAATREADLMGCWSGNNTGYTKIMREFLPAIAQELALELYNKDYYTLDAIFHRGKDEDNFRIFPDTYMYAKYIEIAFEHENSLRGSQVEMNKLQLFNTPLKVLVTYGNKPEQIEYLNTYASIIKSADIFHDISTLRKQLVIFGSCPEKTVIEWSGYVFVNGGFKELIAP